MLKKIWLFAVIIFATCQTIANAQQAQIAELYNKGDYKSAFPLLTLEAESGQSYAQHALGRMYLNGQFVEINKRMAAEWFLKAAENNHPHSANLLGHMYLNGDGIEKDLKKAEKYLLQAAENNVTEAQVTLADTYLQGLFGENKEKDIEYWYYMAALGGDPIGLYYVGLNYFDGITLEVDKGFAYSIMTLSANQGNERAGEVLKNIFIPAMTEEEIIDGIYNLGDAYYNNRWSIEDKSEGLKLLYDAAEKKHVKAQYTLGLHYTYHETDAEKANNWFLKAAEAGYGLAQYEYSYNLMLGTVIPKDYDKALYWANKAVEQNEKYSRRLLATFYQEGFGVEQNFDKAIELYKYDAVEEDNPESFFDIALLYVNEKHMGLNIAKALPWLKRGAEKDHVESQYLLGLFLTGGYNTDEIDVTDIEQALYWLEKAAEKDHVKAHGILFKIYHEGKLVETNHNKALTHGYYQAIIGNTFAQYTLGKLLIGTEQVEPDYVWAYIWLSLAKERNYPTTGSLLDFVTNKATPEQLEQAKAILENFAPMVRQNAANS